MDETSYAWAALGGDPTLLARLSVIERSGTLPARLPVREVARASVSVCALAAAELAALRAGAGAAPVRVPRVRVDDGAVEAAFTSERRLLIDGRAPVSFAPLSRFWRVADGWVRTHANYPHHRRRLLDALGLPRDASAEAVGEVLAGRAALKVEETVQGAGGLAVAVRTPRQWAGHAQGVAVTAQPLVERERLGPGRARAGASG